MSTPASKMDEIVSNIAAEHLGISTLETRMSDSLDFYDLGVWNVRKALQLAFLAGKAEAIEQTSNIIKELVK